MALGASMLAFGGAEAVTRVDEGAEELAGALVAGEKLGNEAVPKTAGLLSPNEAGGADAAAVD